MKRKWKKKEMRRRGGKEEERMGHDNAPSLGPHNHNQGLRRLHNTDLIFSLDFIDGMSAFIIQAPISLLPLGLMVALIQGH